MAAEDTDLGWKQAHAVDMKLKGCQISLREETLSQERLVLWLRQGKREKQTCPGKKMK